MSWEIVFLTIFATIRAGTPLLLATLGEIFAERAGVLNLGLEGMMLIGAWAGAFGCILTGSAWLGLLLAIFLGGVAALIHAFLTITLRAQQVVSGLALTMFGAGISAFLGKPLVGIPVPATFTSLPIPVLGQIPVVGPIFFQQDAIVYLTYLLIPLAAFWLYRTRPGLHMRAVGESPATADAMGVNVTATRYLYTIFGGCLAGLAGAYLSLAYTPGWADGMTGGMGWIAIALVIFATWDPLRAMLGSYLFGLVSAVQFRMQAIGVAIPSYFLSMAPYIATIIVLVLATRETARRRIGAPAALGLPFSREDKS